MTFPADQIAHTLKEPLFTEQVASKTTQFGEITVIGEQHDDQRFITLKSELIIEALAGNLILFEEGLARESETEQNYRIGQGGAGEEPIFGLEDPASQLIDLGVMCRYKALGLVADYAVPCQEAIVNFSSMQPMGQEVWKAVLGQQMNPMVTLLVQDLAPLIEQVQSQPDSQTKLKAFDSVVKQIPMNNLFGWDGLYALIVKMALTKTTSLSPELRDLTETLAGPLTRQTRNDLLSWFNLNSAHRETIYSQNMLSVLEQRQDQLPVVLIVGGNHLQGVLQLIQESEASQLQPQ